MILYNIQIVEVSLQLVPAALPIVHCTMVPCPPGPIIKLNLENDLILCLRHSAIILAQA